MTRRYPCTVNPKYKYQAFLAEKDEKKVKSSPITPMEGPTPTPVGQLLLAIKIQSLDRQKGNKKDAIIPTASMGST